MSRKEFNEKWSDYLKERFYGLEINDENVADYLDKEFEKEVKINPSFKYSQIKLKFDFVVVYADTDKTYEWENKINEILKKK
jgi:hypothetical protein